ncbi:MAG: hypothetical protein ACTSWI_05140 [Alphaproteobacteria bacterium]
MDGHAYHPATDPLLKIEVLVLGAVEPGEGNVVWMPVKISMVERFEERDNRFGGDIYYRSFLEDHRKTNIPRDDAAVD